MKPIDETTDSDNQIGDEGASFVAAALETNRTVSSINLSGEYEMICLWKRTLRVAILLENIIGVGGAKSIAAALETNTIVTNINLNCESNF